MIELGRGLNKDLFESFGRRLLLVLLGMYRTLGTLFLGGACRFEPSCSEYAVEAVKIHEPIFALKLIGIRLLKCRPGGPCGHDPVPCRGHHATTRTH